MSRSRRKKSSVILTICVLSIRINPVSQKPNGSSEKEENNLKSTTMYRFMMERRLFSQLRQQRHRAAIGMTKRYYQCGDNGVYGYRPRKVEPFTRKSLCVCVWVCHRIKKVAKQRHRPPPPLSLASSKIQKTQRINTRLYTCLYTYIYIYSVVWR